MFFSLIADLFPKSTARVQTVAIFWRQLNNMCVGVFDGIMFPWRQPGLLVANLFGQGHRRRRLRHCYLHRRCHCRWLNVNVYCGCHGRPGDLVCIEPNRQLFTQGWFWPTTKKSKSRLLAFIKEEKILLAYFAVDQGKREVNLKRKLQSRNQVSNWKHCAPTHTHRRSNVVLICVLSAFE